MQANPLPRGKHLYLKFDGRSRTGRSTTVTVLIRDPDAQPGQTMQNVSRKAADALEAPWHTSQDAVILQHRYETPNELGDWIAGELGKKIHSEAQAFTWEWI
jgi:hypothetical protein